MIVIVILIGFIFSLMDSIVVVAFYFIGAVAMLNLGGAISSWIIHSSRVDKSSIDAHLIAIAGRVVSWLAIIFLFIKGADDLGIPLTAVVASLGVGGLAIGMAARPTLENLIGGGRVPWDHPDLRFFTRVRWCDARGRVPRNSDEPGEPFAPWDAHYRGDAIVVFGHWAARGLVLGERVRGLDTGCVWGGRLTAWIAEEDRIVSVPSRAQYQDPT